MGKYDKPVKVEDEEDDDDWYDVKYVEESVKGLQLVAKNLTFLNIRIYFSIFSIH